MSTYEKELHNNSDANRIQVGSLFDDMPLTGAHWKAGLTIFMAFVIESWEMMILILVSGLIGAEFNLTGVQIGSLIGSLFLGMIPGCLAWGKITDIIGRKKTMIYSLILYGVFSLISALSVSYEMLWVMRFIAGVSLSGVLVVAFPYFEELLPVKSRGRAAVYLASGWPLGYLIAIGITYFVSDDGGWRWVIGFSSLAGLWAFVVALIPESPYWLAGRGRQTEAKDIIKYLSGNKMNRQLDDVNLFVEDFKEGSYLETFKGKYLRITIIQMIINFCFTWGYWGLTSWMPVLLATKGFSSPQGLGFMAISAVFMFPGYMASSYLTGKFGRRLVMFWFVLLSACAGFGFATSNSMTQMYMWNFGLSFFSLGAWGVWDTWMAELYPTEIRGVGYAWGLSSGRVANTIAPTVIGAMLAAKTSFMVTVSFISIFLVITFIAIWFLKETEGEILQ